MLAMLLVDLKCWAYSPPGGLVSESLLPAMRDWCVSVVCGKDAVPRMTVNNLSRLMDEMITALARSRCGFTFEMALGRYIQWRHVRHVFYFTFKEKQFEAW